MKRIFPFQNGFSNTAWIIAMTVFLLAGCTGDEQTPLFKGRFFDEKVQGVEYRCANKYGLTDSEGGFYFSEGDEISFYIGDILIGGPVPAALLMSPLDFADTGEAFTSNPKIINICRFLQTLDQDGDPENGIFISPEIRSSLSGFSVDFDVSAEAFENSTVIAQILERLNTNAVFTNGGYRTLRSIDESVGHFEAAMAEYNLGRFVMIALGDGFAAGVQSGAANMNQYTQGYGFSQVLADRLVSASELVWNQPALTLPEEGAAPSRIDGETLPYNMSVAGASIKNVIDEQTASGNALLDEVLKPIPDQKGTAVSQLEAAEYVANLYPDRVKLFVVHAGFNDILGAATRNEGGALTAESITQYLSDAGAGRDPDSLYANLAEIMERLGTIPNSYVFMADLPYVETIGALFYESDLEFIAAFENSEITALGDGNALGYKAFRTLSGPEFNYPLNSTSTNDSANEAVSALATDENVLSKEEAALIDNRVDQFNTWLNTLAGAYDNVFVVDTNGLFLSLYNGQVEIEVEFADDEVQKYLVSRTFGGGFYSLDGVHPSHTGYALMADRFISSINNELAIVNMEPPDMAQIWVTDPYRDNDGDSFVSGPANTDIIDNTYEPLLDCDDDDTAVIAPHVGGEECD